MKKNLIFLLFLLLMGTFTAHATAPGWFGPYAVTAIEPHASGVYFLKPDDQGFPDFGCGTQYVFFANDGKLADRALAVGLTAQLTTKKVMYYLGGCSGGYISATAIQTHPGW